MPRTRALTTSAKIICTTAVRDKARKECSVHLLVVLAKARGYSNTSDKTISNLCKDPVHDAVRNKARKVFTSW